MNDMRILPGELKKAILFWGTIISIVFYLWYKYHYLYYEPITRPFRPQIERYMLPPLYHAHESLVVKDVNTPNQNVNNGMNSQLFGMLPPDQKLPPFFKPVETKPLQQLILKGKIIPIEYAKKCIFESVLDKLPLHLKPLGPSQVKYAVWIVHTMRSARKVVDQKQIGDTTMTYYRGYVTISEYKISIIDIDTRTCIFEDVMDSDDFKDHHEGTDIAAYLGKIPYMRKVKQDLKPEVHPENLDVAMEMHVEPAPLLLGMRVLNMPNERSAGLVYVKKCGERTEGLWNCLGVGLGKDRGAVIIPEGFEAKLKVKKLGPDHLRFMQNIQNGCLQEVILDVPTICDKDIENIKHLNKLCVLDLSGTAITDACNSSIKEMKGLGKLILTRTNITPNGVAELRKSLVESIEIVY